MRANSPSWAGTIHQEDPIHMCTQDGNAKKGCYLFPDTYLGIFSVPDLPGCIVILLNPPWTHPLWYGDLHLSGAYVCFPNQGYSSVCPSLIFSVQEHIIFVGVFYQNLQYPSLLTKILI